MDTEPIQLDFKLSLNVEALSLLALAFWEKIKPHVSGEVQTESKNRHSSYKKCLKKDRSTTSNSKKKVNRTGQKTTKLGEMNQTYWPTKAPPSAALIHPEPNKSISAFKRS